MKPIFIVGACVAAVYADAVEPASSNLIKNGDFVENLIGSGEWTISKSLPGWEIPNEV